MADLELTIGANLSEAEAKLAAFKAEANQAIRSQFGGTVGNVGGTGRPNVPAGDLAHAFPPPPGVDPTAWRSTLSSVPQPGAGGTAQQVQAAGQQLAAAVSSVAQQVRTAGGGSGGIGGGGGGAGRGWGTFGAWNAATNQTVPLAYDPGAQAFFNIENGMQMAGVDWPGMPGGPGGQGGQGGGGGGNGGSSRFNLRSRMRFLRGLMYTFGAGEAYHAYRDDALASARQSVAGNLSEEIDANTQGAKSLTSGFFGSMIGMGLDIADWAGVPGVPSPTKIEQMGIVSRGRLRAGSGISGAIAGKQIAGNDQIAGKGKYGTAFAAIANRYLSDDADIRQKEEDAATASDPITASLYKLTARMLREAALTRRSTAKTELSLDLEDDVAGFGDEASVARGGMTSGQARRAAMIRRHARSTTPWDVAYDTAEQGAFDASEGYRIWGREYAATSGRDQAYFAYNRQPNVARAVGMYSRGILESENAQREGSSNEADLIRQRTAYELAGFRRQLLDSGSASYAENGMAIDFGQGGPGGRSSNNVGDDLLEAIQKISEFMPYLPQILEAL